MWKMQIMKDRYGRKIEYMRVSVTDRCDLRCRYCMPEGCRKVPMSQILSYEEIVRICRAASQLGISRIKITGGEPFVRLGCTDLIRSIKSIDGIEEVTVTTNGQTLTRYISELKDIGIDGINISLDTLDPGRFRLITGRGDLEKTINAIDASVDAGIKTKVNCLIQKGFNDDEIVQLAELAFKKGIDVRFIEMMPIGTADPESGLPNSAVFKMIKDKWQELEPDKTVHGNGPAVYYRMPDKTGGIGFISAMHDSFCSSCNRVRLTSQGQLKPCLCYEEGTDLKPFLSRSDDELRTALRDAILLKPEAHCFEKICSGDGDECGNREKRYMSQIGG